MPEITEVYYSILAPWSRLVYTFPDFRGNYYWGKLLSYAGVLAKDVEMKNIYFSTNHIGQ